MITLTENDLQRAAGSLYDTATAADDEPGSVVRDAWAAVGIEDPESLILRVAGSREAIGLADMISGGLASDETIGLIQLDMRARDQVTALGHATDEDVAAVQEAHAEAIAERERERAEQGSLAEALL